MLCAKNIKSSRSDFDRTALSRADFHLHCEIWMKKWPRVNELSLRYVLLDFT